MARFARSQDGRLTLVFADREDLVAHALSITEAMGYLTEKYENQKPDTPILAVLDIRALEPETGTEG